MSLELKGVWYAAHLQHHYDIGIGYFFDASHFSVAGTVSPSYIQIKNRTDCKTYNPFPKSGERASWSGRCKNGYTQGNGDLQWYDSNGKLTEKSSGYKDSLGRFQGNVLNYMLSMNGDLVLRVDASYKDDVANGYGEFYFDDGKYVGEFSDGKISGKGRFFRKDSGVIFYDGHFVNGSRDGHGKSYDSQGRLFLMVNLGLISVRVMARKFLMRVVMTFLEK